MKLFDIRLPLWVSLLLIAFFAVSVLFVVSQAATQYQIVKPHITEWLSTASPLQISGYTLNYDINQTKYTSATVTVRNVGSVRNYGVIGVYLYDAQGAVVASGQAQSGWVDPGLDITGTVTLTWVAGKGMLQVAYGKVTIVPASAPATGGQ